MTKQRRLDVVSVAWAAAHKALCELALPDGTDQDDATDKAVADAESVLWVELCRLRDLAQS